jgi:hypothetical protein
MLNRLPKFCENTYVVRSDAFRTDRETTLLPLAGTFAAGEEFAESHPAGNKVVRYVIVD